MSRTRKLPAVVVEAGICSEHGPEVRVGTGTVEVTDFEESTPEVIYDSGHDGPACVSTPAFSSGWDHMTAATGWGQRGQA
jgi:hypothetical protein